MWIIPTLRQSSIADFGCPDQEAYLYTAALAELKTGSQVKSRNDGVALKSMTAVLQREADAIRQKLNEDMQRLHSDIQVSWALKSSRTSALLTIYLFPQLDMNQRKEETSQELKALDINIMVGCRQLLGLRASALTRLDPSFCFSRTSTVNSRFCSERCGQRLKPQNGSAHVRSSSLFCRLTSR